MLEPHLNHLHWERLSQWLIAAGTTIAVGTGLITGSAPKFLFGDTSVPTVVAAAVSCAGVLAAVVASVRSHWPTPWLLLAAFWLFVSVTNGSQARVGEVTTLVMPSEALFLTFALLTQQGRYLSWVELKRFWIAVAASFSLLVFAAVHWLNRTELLGLLPSWFPHDERFFLFTALLQALAASALLFTITRKFAALAVASMFASWVFAIHVPRVLADPTSAFEWQFGAMAICLVGAFIGTAHSNQSPTTGDT